jgi:hypothetical protein
MTSESCKQHEILLDLKEFMQEQESDHDGKSIPPNPLIG